MIPIGNLDFGHLIDTLTYLASPTPKSCRFCSCSILTALGLCSCCPTGPPLGLLGFHPQRLPGAPTPISRGTYPPFLGVPTPISRGTYSYFQGYLLLFQGAPTPIFRGTYPCYCCDCDDRVSVRFVTKCTRAALVSDSTWFKDRVIAIMQELSQNI